MSDLIESIRTIKNECREHPMCKNCPIYDEKNGCIVEPLPCDWKISNSAESQKGSEENEID